VVTIDREEFMRSLEVKVTPFGTIFSNALMAASIKISNLGLPLSEADAVFWSPNSNMSHAFGCYLLTSRWMNNIHLLSVMMETME
jgi:hypothetical protein